METQEDSVFIAKSISTTFHNPFCHTLFSGCTNYPVGGGSAVHDCTQLNKKLIMSAHKIIIIEKKISFPTRIKHLNHEQHKNKTPSRITPPNKT